MSKQRLSVQEAARALGITLDAVYRLCKAGKLEAKKRADGTWSISHAALLVRRTERAKLARRIAKKKAA